MGYTGGAASLKSTAVDWTDPVTQVSCGGTERQLGSCTYRVTDGRLMSFAVEATCSGRVQHLHLTLPIRVYTRVCMFALATEQEC